MGIWGKVMKQRRGWFRNALLALLLFVLAAVAFRALFPQLAHHLGMGHGHHGEAYHEAHGDEYDHGKWWRHHVFGKGPWHGMRSCPKENRWIQTRIYMGRDVDRNRLGVSEAEWNSFLDDEIRTRLPDGFSVEDVYGYSAVDNPDHQKWTKVLILLHDGSEAKLTALDEIKAAYLGRFPQQAVLRSDSVACVEFVFGQGDG